MRVRRKPAARVVEVEDGQAEKLVDAPEAGIDGERHDLVLAVPREVDTRQPADVACTEYHNLRHAASEPHEHRELVQRIVVAERDRMRKTAHAVAKHRLRLGVVQIVPLPIRVGVSGQHVEGEAAPAHAAIASSSWSTRRPTRPRSAVSSFTLKTPLATV